MATETRYVDHYQGERKQDRRTPLGFFVELHKRFDFTLDGAATSENALLPKFSSEEDPKPWKGERVFCNPPWSGIPPFVELAAQAEIACLLVPARTNCKWFHRALALGAKPEYWLGKLSFGGPWNSPIDCLLLIWGSPKVPTDIVLACLRGLAGRLSQAEQANLAAQIVTCIRLIESLAEGRVSR